MKVSASIITLNAAAHLDRCLDSLDWCDEVVVLDQGSTDGTREICARHGATVLDGEWRGFGPTKAACVLACRNRWILSVDADEVVDAALRDAIRALPDDPSQAAFRVDRRSRFLGRWIRHCGWTPDRLLRLFDRDRAGFDDAPVHEAVHARGPVGDLPGLLLHHTYDSLEQYLAKLDRYSTLGAEAAVSHGRRATPAGAVLRAHHTFVRTYWMRRGFLDGAHGLALCSLMAFQTLAKYLKIWHAGRRAGAGSDGNEATRP